MRVKACNATTQWLGLDAHEFLSPDQKFKRALWGSFSFLRDDMREAGAGCTPPPPNMNRLKGLYERHMCFLIQFQRVSLG